MKRILACLLLIGFTGCSYDMENIMKDPHFAQYQESMDALESQYLHKKISYSEYQTQRKELEDKYDREVKQREDKIHQETPGTTAPGTDNP